MRELFRRIVLVVALSIALNAARYVDFGEFLQVTQIKDSKLRSDVQKDWSLEKKDKERLLEMTYEKLLRERVKKTFRIVSGDVWKEFFDKAKQGFESGRLSPDWRKKAEFSMGSLFSLWFQYDESPWNTLYRETFLGDDDELILMLNEEKPFALKVRHRILNTEDFIPLSGFSTSTPPRSMLYPFRKYAIWIALAGIFFYIFFPWTKKMPGSAYVKRWSVILLDFMALLMFFPFFLLGWMLAGPIPVGPNGGWIIGGVLWLMCLGGLYLFKQGTFYAFFAMKAEEDGLRVRTWQGEIKLPYQEIEKVQGAVLRNPGWMTSLMTLGAIFGRGSRRYLASGQALMLAGARYPGLAFTLKKGGTIYLWGSGQGGMSTFDQIGAFQEGLKKAGVSIEKKSADVRGFGTEPRFDKASDIRGNWMMRNPFLILALTPFLVTAVIHLVALFI